MVSYISPILRMIAARGKRGSEGLQEARAENDPLLRGAASQQPEELIHTETCVPDDSPQGTSIQLLMVGHNYLGKGLISPKDDVASVLPFEVEAGLLKGFDLLAARNPGQLAHTASTSVSKRSSGIGRPSSSNAAMYA